MTCTRLAFLKTWGGLKVESRELVVLLAELGTAKAKSERAAEKTADVFILKEEKKKKREI
jgi:hypothetical protein